MAFSEDLSTFFEQKDFAVEAIVNGRSMKVIFDSPTEPVDSYGTDVEAEALYFHCETAEFASTGAVINSTAQIDGVSYKIKKITRDGTGVSTIFLKT